MADEDGPSNHPRLVIGATAVLVVVLFAVAIILNRAMLRPGTDIRSTGKMPNPGLEAPTSQG
jgi:hypothetical protein